MRGEVIFAIGLLAPHRHLPWAKSYRDTQTELQIFPRVEPTLPNEHIAAIH